MEFNFNSDERKQIQIHVKFSNARWEIFPIKMFIIACQSNYSILWNTMQFAKVSRQRFNFSKHTHTHAVIVAIIKCNDINKFDILMNENLLYSPPHGATRCWTDDNAFFSFLFNFHPTWCMQPNTIPPVVCDCVDVRKSCNLNFHRVDFALIMPSGYSLSFPLSNAACICMKLKMPSQFHRVQLPIYHCATCNYACVRQK